MISLFFFSSSVLLWILNNLLGCLVCISTDLLAIGDLFWISFGLSQDWIRFKNLGFGELIFSVDILLSTRTSSSPSSSGMASKSSMDGIDLWGYWLSCSSDCVLLFQKLKWNRSRVFGDWVENIMLESGKQTKKISFQLIVYNEDNCKSNSAGLKNIMW